MIVASGYQGKPYNDLKGTGRTFHDVPDRALEAVSVTSIIAEMLTRKSLLETTFMSDKPISTAATDALYGLASRRSFLRKAAATAIAGGALAACSDSKAQKTAPGAADASGGTTAPNPVPPSPKAAAAAMDAMHEAGIKAFPAKTEGKGSQLLAPRIEKGVKVYELTASQIQWETAPGKKVEAWAYNEQVPGPQIRVREGDRVKLILHNKLTESTAIHFHGLELPNAVDGVPFITQPPVKSGESYTYEFTIPDGNHGSHMYHSHHNSAKQVGLGLLGAFIVEPKKPMAIEKVDVDHLMILNDGMHGYTLNGKSFPGTEPIRPAKPTQASPSVLHLHSYKPYPHWCWPELR